MEKILTPPIMKAHDADTIAKNSPRRSALLENISDTKPQQKWKVAAIYEIALPREARKLGFKN